MALRRLSLSFTGLLADGNGELPISKLRYRLGSGSIELNIEDVFIGLYGVAL